eukprot:TRINITY_DN2564_c4_g1_i1.p2 TRINITY_DN2564_c4_g1~~TRINITY_DN2564_c4_g1_i1.p2  ORF type:complete len:552 (+),score=144.43 TRINITY_DN2564_c4_g1_i1:334-1989(+)
MNAQLKRYQALVPLIKQEEEEEVKEEPEEFVMLVAEHPLIQAYEQHVYETEKANKQLLIELKSLKATHQQLEREAAELSRKLLEKTEELAKTGEKDLGGAEGFDFLGGGVKGTKEIYDILDHLKKEQEVLLNEIDIAKTKAIKCENDLKIQTQLAEEYEAKFKEYQNKNYQLENDLETAIHERDILSNRLNLKLTELKSVQTEREELYNQKARFEGEVKLLQRNVEQYKSGYEDLESRKATEVEQLEKELNEKGILVKDAKSKLLVQEREMEDLKEINRKLQRDLELTKNDVAQMLKIMEDNETKLALFDEREKTLKQKEQEAKRKIEEAKIRQDEFSHKEKQYQRQLAQLEEQWRQDLEERQKKYDAVLEAAKSKQKTLLAKREEEYNELYEKCGRLQTSLDKLQADFRALEEENRRLKSALNEEQRNATDKHKGYEQEIRDIQRKAADEKRKLQSQLDDSQRNITKLEDKLKTAEQEHWTLKQQVENLETVAKDKDQEFKEMKSVLSERTLEKENAFKEVERLKKVHQAKCDELTELYNMKVKAFIQKV